jgi:hypothetical protein
MVIPMYDGDVTRPTLENRDFLIPEGTYPLDKTYSPKFKKFLPEVQNVPERTGIRIHGGSIPEHSTGCILLDLRGMATINAFMNQIEQFYENESAELIVRSEGSLKSLVPLPRNGD